MSRNSEGENSESDDDTAQESDDTREELPKRAEKLLKEIRETLQEFDATRDRETMDTTEKWKKEKEEKQIAKIEKKRQLIADVVIKIEQSSDGELVALTAEANDGGQLAEFLGVADIDNTIIRRLIDYEREKRQASVRRQEDIDRIERTHKLEMEKMIDQERRKTLQERRKTLQWRVTLAVTFLLGVGGWIVALI